MHLHLRKLSGGKNARAEEGARDRLSGGLMDWWWSGGWMVEWWMGGGVVDGWWSGGRVVEWWMGGGVIDVVVEV